MALALSDYFYGYWLVHYQGFVSPVNANREGGWRNKIFPYIRHVPGTSDAPQESSVEIWYELSAQEEQIAEHVQWKVKNKNRRSVYFFFPTQHDRLQITLSYHSQRSNTIPLLLLLLHLIFWLFDECKCWIFLKVWIYTPLLSSFIVAPVIKWWFYDTPRDGQFPRSQLLSNPSFALHFLIIFHFSVNESSHAYVQVVITERVLDESVCGEGGNKRSNDNA